MSPDLKLSPTVPGVFLTADQRYEYFGLTGELNWHNSARGFNRWDTVGFARSVQEAERIIDAHMTETATAILTGAA